MSIDMSQFYQVFFEEAAEHLAAMETLLVAVNVDAPNADDLDAIFRAAHSIKGGAGTFGFTDMAEVTHILETLLDRVRKNELALRSEMIDAFLQVGDVLRTQLDSHRHGSPVDEATVRSICERLQQLADDAGLPNSRQAIRTGSAASPVSQIYQIAFRRIAKAKLGRVIEELRRSGTVLVTDEVPDAALAVRFATSLSAEAVWETLEFVVSRKQVTVVKLSPTPSEATDAYGFFDQAPGIPAAEDDEGFGFFGDAPGAPASGMAVEDESFGFFVPEEELKARIDEAEGYGLFSDAPGAEQIDGSRPQAQGGGQRRPPTTNARRPGGQAERPAAPNGEASSIRVSVEKVDQLINLVGELVITQAMLAQTTGQVDPGLYESLLNSVSQLERNTRDLQEAVMSIRMLPISFVFSRFPRVVRDIATKLGKQVELRTIGEGTELDKGLIEKIADPLTHLVRNSLDHGIESPETRVAAGKAAKGVLTLQASHQGGNIVIEVADDGGGLNRDRILSKARERGLAVSDGMSDQEVWQLIFAPGFSTADVVTDVSGRGVGMDVVKRNIEGIGGRVELSSNPGHGTTVTIRLPLTLAILDGMSVAVQDEIFIVPLGYIVESLQPSPQDVKTVAGEGRVVSVRGEYLPLVALHTVLNIKPRTTKPHEGILVIIEADGQKAALFVDDLVGQHQVVIKSLESNYRKVPGISAATIMGDGRVALILDVAALVRLIGAPDTPLIAA
jgi:two-component system chemotaxis sensor kinase CheA